jgi:phosphoglycerate dehydrogenase-like enzyme
MTRIGLLFDDSGWDVPAIRDALPGSEVDFCGTGKDLDACAYADLVRSYDAVVGSRGSAKLPVELAEDLGRCKLYAYCHGSIKGYVPKELIEAGLAVSNWGDNVDGVAESAMCLILACLKQLPQLDRFIRADWSDDRRINQAFPARLKQCDVGLYGFGPIGRHCARMLSVFGARIAIYDPYAEDIPDDIRVCATLEELFDSCQVISIHCGLNDDTRHSVNGDLLRRLPQGGVVVNTARGAVVVEEDLAAELKAGRLVAGVDVIENERNWAGCALAETECILTGHVLTNGKGMPKDKRPPKRLSDFVIHNLRCIADGRSDDLINLIPAEIYDLKT